MGYRILLIEDDCQLREIIEDSFKAKSEGNMEIVSVDDGAIGLETALYEDFDLILLDIMLPGLDGFSVMRTLRKSKDVPIIILTARTKEDDVLHGYQLGCDDYVTKPFSTATLYAKVLALINRDKRTVVTHTLTCGDITIDTRALTVTVAGEEILLQPTAYNLLCCLVEHKGWVVDRETLITKVWGSDFEGGTRVVDNHIKKLRKSLGSSGKQIKTIISKGYKIE